MKHSTDQFNYHSFLKFITVIVAVVQCNFHSIKLGVSLINESKMCAIRSLFNSHTNLTTLNLSQLSMLTILCHIMETLGHLITAVRVLIEKFCSTL